MKGKSNILFLPGLGADRRMYNMLIGALEREIGAKNVLATHLDFIGPRRNESLAEYSARLWSESGTKRKRYDCIVACSFGGMIVQELLSAGIVQTPRLVLISTAFTGRDIGFIARWLARLADLIPASQHAFVRDRMAAVYPVLRIRKRYASEMAAMIKAMPAELLFYSAKMIRRWRVPLNDGARRISRGLAPTTLFVMGGRDPIILYDRVRVNREPDLFVPEGDHFIALTRADEIAAAMKQMK